MNGYSENKTIVLFQRGLIVSPSNGIFIVWVNVFLPCRALSVSSDTTKHFIDCVSWTLIMSINIA